MSTLLRCCAIISILFYASGYSSFAIEDEKNFQIEITVNGNVITNYDLQQRMLLFKIFNISEYKNKDDVKQFLVEESLQEQFVDSRGVQLSSTEAKKNMADFLQLQQINKTDLFKLLSNNNIETSEFERYLEIKALWKKALLQSYGKKAIISQYELNLPPETRPTETNLLNLSEIVIPFAEHGKNKSLLLANRLKIELTAGGSFSEAARRFSRSQSRGIGGKIGLVDETKLPIKLRKLLSNLSRSEITKPIINEDTVILFKLNGKEKKILDSSLDYLVDYLIIDQETKNGVQTCKEFPADSRKRMLMSQVSKNHSAILRRINLYEPSKLDDANWIILCERKVKGTSQQINKKKSKYFNDKMIAFSKKLMLQLYREATIQ